MDNIMNDSILTNDAFISTYVISMFLFPIILFLYFASSNTEKNTFLIYFVMIFMFITFLLLASASTIIYSKNNVITYDIIISFSMFFVPLVIIYYVFNNDLPKIENLYSKFFINIFTYVVTICIMYMNLIAINRINYFDAIPNSKNPLSLNILLMMITTVFFIFYAIPKIISFFLYFWNAENKLDTVKFLSNYYSSVSKDYYYDFLNKTDSFQSKFKENNQKKDPTNNEENPIYSTFSKYFGYLKSYTTDIIFVFSKIISDFFKNILKDISPEETQPVLIKYGAIYSAIFTILVLLYLAAFDPTALTSKAYVYTFSVFFALIFLFSFVISFKDQGNSMSKLFSIGFGVIFFIGILYSYSSLDNTTFSYISYAINALMALIVLFGLAIFFYIFGNYLKSFNNTQGFFIYFIFYIPCLIIDYFKYLLNEIRMTSFVIYLLFIVEVMLILLYIYSDDIIRLVVSKTSNSIILLEKSAFLDLHSTIGDSYQLRLISPVSKDPNNQIIYNNNYAISMWLYLNNQPPNNYSYSKETEIFNYGNGKPRITYINDTAVDKNKDRLVFYFTNNSTDSYSLTLPGQKWNNIVFNYYTDKVNLFINGNLERTYVFNNNAPTFSPPDLITIGSENGLDGAICNVVYYSNQLNKTRIATLYNLLMMKNPPTLV